MTRSSFHPPHTLALLLVSTIVVLPGCPEEGTSDDELTIVVRADTEKIAKEAEAIALREAELEAQRTELLAARKRLLNTGTQKQDLRVLIEQQKKLLAREQALRGREAEVASARGALDAEKTRLLVAGARPRGTGAVDPSASRQLVDRESKMAGREADLARREKALASREAAMGRREASLAAAAAAPPARISSGDPGRRVGRREVERAHKKARQKMRRRGILPADLSGDAANLQQQIYRHARAGRWVQAWDAVEAFEQAIETVAIDEAFVQSKMTRLNAVRKKARLSREKKQEVDRLLAAATGAFVDGRPEQANTRLNEIFGILRGR